MSSREGQVSLPWEQCKAPQSKKTKHGGGLRSRHGSDGASSTAGWNGRASSGSHPQMNSNVPQQSAYSQHQHRLEYPFLSPPPQSSTYSANGRGYQAGHQPPVLSPILSTAPNLQQRAVHVTPQLQTGWEAEHQAMMNPPPWQAQVQQQLQPPPPPPPCAPQNLMTLNAWGGHESFPIPSAEWLRDRTSSEEQEGEKVKDHEQSSGLHVRNTFFESSCNARSPSLEPFVRERRSHSQPSSPRLANCLSTRPDFISSTSPDANGAHEHDEEDFVYPELGSGIFETPSASISEEMLGRSLRGSPLPFGGHLVGEPMAPARPPSQSVVDLVAEFNAGVNSSQLGLNVNRPQLDLPRRPLADSPVAKLPGSPEGGWTASTTASNPNSCKTSNTGSGEVPAERRQSWDSDAAEKPAVGSAQLPSRGSALHRWGACKPCAFVFAGGCQNRVECEFCHLCGPGEKRRRRKDRQGPKKEVEPERPTKSNDILQRYN